MKLFLLSSLVALLYTLGDSSATKYFHAEHKYIYRIFFGILFNSIGVILFGYLGSRYNIASISGLILTLNIVGNIIFGVIYFHQHISFMQYVGLLLGAGAILILSYYN